MPPVRIGISACLTGQAVRHDGRDKRDDPLLAALAEHAVLIPVCPEVELGMGVPREPVELAGDPAAPRMLGVHSGTDHTALMRDWASRRTDELAALGLDGFVLMDRSPSCGLHAVAVRSESVDTPALVGKGLFAAELTSRQPALPVEEAGRLADPGALQAFLKLAMAHRAER